ncbi:MAG TPA: nitroreductase family protein [candidate division WOR-3 bacterium]|uniref:Nitroreductase family protein n=1 Tax=candidate division WOR-3 bacterium TaxID=2052148 RepID=A0A7V0T605_UNCW3|nr:nitroreductase family protein [candidate division WOR-3 bacterium]
MDPRLKALFARRSVRRYTGAPVAEADLRALLEAAMAAPSARDLQPWRFVVVTGRERLDRLAGIHPYAQMLKTAGACIAVCGDRKVNADFWVQDCAAATENILVAAAMLGLGAVWLGVHPRAEREDALKQYLGLPEDFGLLCLIAVGHPAESPSPRTRYDPDKVRPENWGRTTGQDQNRRMET